MVYQKSPQIASAELVTVSWGGWAVRTE